MNALRGAAPVALRMKTMWQASPWDQRAGGKRRRGGLGQPSLGMVTSDNKHMLRLPMTANQRESMMKS